MTRVQVTRVFLVAVTASVVALSPPYVLFSPQPLLGMLFFASIVVGIFWPSQPHLRLGGEAACWVLIGWCVLSQPAPLLLPSGVVLGTRGIALLLIITPWCWLRFRVRWQRRTLCALTVPLAIGLFATVGTSPPQPLMFRPEYVAASSDRVYITDNESPVIRVFDTSGALIGKIRPGLASVQGPPGPGMFPTGPYNDPDRLGIARARGSHLTHVAVQPWPVGADDFWFTGITVDSAGNLFVPDWMRERLLRFASDGRLLTDTKLPPGFSPTLGCVAWHAGSLYLSETDGEVLQLDAMTGALERSIQLPSPATGGLVWDTRGNHLLALGTQQVYEVDANTGHSEDFPLPPPSTALSKPYEAIAALANGEIAIADLGTRSVLIYTSSGALVRELPRAQAGIGQATTVAANATGRFFVADTDLRVVEEYDLNGHLRGQYRGADDDEKD